VDAAYDHSQRQIGTSSAVGREMGTRREILAAGASMLALGTTRLFADIPRAAKPLNLLILGGTGFIGPHQVEYALARGHRVTLFNRGRGGATFSGKSVEVLIGDRDPKTGPGLTALQGTRRWDAVIDNSAYVPRYVRESGQLLKGRVGRYLYVSTSAVYDGTQQVCHEDSPLLALRDPDDEKVTAKSYGALKAEGDRVIRALYGSAATVVRPTYVAGPGDETDRFTYWVVRTAAGGTVVGPRRDAKDLQVVDVRDLCPWLVTLVEQDTSGVFNAACPRTPWDRVLAALRPATAPPLHIVRPTGATIGELKVDFPLVEPTVEGGIFANERMSFDGSRAQKVGLNYRSMTDTGRATLEWWNTQTAERRAATRDWPTAAQEKAVLARS
jgi:2'-hydroxyisoflavone reductase